MSLLVGIGPAVASVTLQVPQDHPTTQAAINAAPPGETIFCIRIYGENLIIDRSVSIVAGSFDPADPRSNTTILDGGRGTVITVKAGVAPGPTFTGLVIRGGRTGSHAEPDIRRPLLSHWQRARLDEGHRVRRYVRRSDLAGTSVLRRRRH